MLVRIGDDWAEDHHDVEVQDEAGRRLGKARLEDGIEGIARLHTLISFVRVGLTGRGTSGASDT